jgi:hypothetical protein
MLSVQPTYIDKIPGFRGFAFHEVLMTAWEKAEHLLAILQG